MLGWQRFNAKDVKRCMTHLPCIKRRKQRIVINQRTPARIDEKCARSQ
jgi:hypothetical protein